LNCNEIQQLVHGYVDGELDLVRSLEIEQHLRECPACPAALASQQAVRASLAGAGLYHGPPTRLGERIRGSLRQAAGGRPAARARPWRALAVAASVAFVVLMTGGIVRVLSLPSANDLRAEEVVSAYVRSLVTDHQVAVRSSNKHVVGPWFNGKVDLAPPVENWKDDGFPLIGGRLDYPLDNRKAAVLVYHCHEHAINVFIWPASVEADQPVRTTTRQGYHLIHWARNRLVFWVISDLNEEELQEFVRLFQRGTPQKN
jgi:anti-sigma factor RsiW